MCIKNPRKMGLPAGLAFLFFMLPLIVLAQGPPDPEDTPIDGGLLLLLASGAAYGVKKYREVKNGMGKNL